ncbi:glycosyltransferase [Mesorhizobium sp. PL10]
MRNGKRLCLNMIVKNEMANLQRCLGAVVDHIDCWVIGDTGSTDGTQDFVKSFFAARNLPGELHEFPFHNFEQARNAALDHAYASPLAYDYLLFDDADMELMVEDAGFRERLDGPGYRLLQRSDSGLAYWNTRLVKRDAGARYHGVTHEYLDVPGGVQELRGAWYKDHASGSNRVDKFERDARLLLEALEKDPENQRYWFYLAQSYRDAGRTAEAAVAYAKRAAMGGWDEEAWNARLQEARCLRKLGDEAGFVQQALAAFNQRPQRAEPLYDLARFYREKGVNDASVLFSEAGLAIKRPEQDILFIEDFVYTTGLREEYAIAANYAHDPVRKDRGFAMCNWLALDRSIAYEHRELARSNLFFYLQPAKTTMPSFSARPLGFTPPDGYRPSSPSVTRLGAQIVLVQPTVTYTPNGDGRADTPNETPSRTRNFLVHLNEDLVVQSAAEILAPADLPEPGFEAIRLFARGEQLWTVACSHALMADSWWEPIIARLDGRQPNAYQMTEWRVLHPLGQKLHDTSWMPLIKPAGIDTDNEQLQFFCAGDPVRIVDDMGQTISETVPAVCADQFRGSTQAIVFDGGWLALIREGRARPNETRPTYQHRFVWFDDAGRLGKVSRPFFFNDKGSEFAAGLTWHPNEEQLLISYGVSDSESWIATVNETEVRGMLEDAQLPSAASGTEVSASNAASSVAKATHFAASPRQPEKPSIPRTFHFITGLDGNFGGKPFSFIHYMAIRSALQVNQGFRAKVYYHHEPSGTYWDAIKGDVELICVELPTEVFGNPVEHFAHKADVLRLRILLEQGGIYLDLDTICQRPFEPLLDGRVVMGREEGAQNDGSRRTVGLCNATIIAPPNAEFLRLWYEAYRNFTGGTVGDAWNKFSVQVPMELAKERPELLRIEPAASFFWPGWDQASLEDMFSKDREFPEAFSFHLWESQSWPLAKDLDANAVMEVDTTYNKIARRFVASSDSTEELKRHFSLIYEKHGWGRGSGVGSAPDKTVEYRDFLQRFMTRNDIRTVVDLGCGDWQFSRYVDWSGVSYVGIDVVSSVIERNQREFSSGKIAFETFKSLEKLPPADLLICKDVLQHLPNKTVMQYLAAFRNKYKFALITNDEEPAQLQNTDIEVAGWRTLRLDREPFSEQGASVFSWTVLGGSASTKKSTFLLLGDALSADAVCSPDIFLGSSTFKRKSGSGAP